MIKRIILSSLSAYSSLAQSVEHSAVNRVVVGSSPTGGAIYFRRLSNSPKTKGFGLFGYPLQLG